MIVRRRLTFEGRNPASPGGRPPAPGRPLVIDRLEFNEALRQVDPFEEMSYLAVECRRLGAD